MAKLVEILARELKGWKINAGGAVFSSKGGACYFFHGNKPAYDDYNWRATEGCFWFVGESDKLVLNGDTPDDHATAIVTRAEWQAAVDALKAKEVVEWDGVGLPPVGAVCQFKDDMSDGSDWHNKLESGMEVKIVAHFENNGVQIAAFTLEWARGCMQVEQAVAGCFAPIHTTEQIAAEERRRGIADIAEDLGKRTWGVTIQEWLYDLGYRKQEPK